MIRSRALLVAGMALARGAGEALEVEVAAEDTSSCYGGEVVQADLTFPEANGVPLRALRGSSGVHVPAGEIRPA